MPLDPVLSLVRRSIAAVRRRRPLAKSLASAGALVVAGAAGLAGCTGIPAGVTPVTPFDAKRYEGTWYSVHRLDHSFERGLTNVSARYRLQPDGSVQVVNRGFDHEACEWKQVIGRAKFRGDTDVASLKVSFFGPFYGGYHVFALDPEYRWAMISGPTHGYLWILAREPQLAPGVRERLVALKNRYDPGNLFRMNHNVEPSPASARVAIDDAGAHAPAP